MLEVLKWFVEEVFFQAALVVVAIAGYNAWKKEFVDKRKINVAEQLYDKFIRLKEVFKYVRGPLIIMGDLKTTEEGLLITRFEAVRQDLVDLHELCSKFELVFPEYEKKVEIKRIQDLIEKLNHAIQFAIKITVEKIRREPEGIYVDKLRDKESVVDKEIEAIEEQINEHIKPLVQNFYRGKAKK